MVSILLSTVMDELGAALATIEGLRVKSYTEQRINPPMATVNLPRVITYDSTYGRGSDDIEIPIVVHAGRFDAESSRNAISQYVDGRGGTSVKEAIEGHVPAAGSYDIAHVMDAQFLISAVAGVDYLTATFRVRLVGKG
ncbi:MAG TPA: hypothetical protein VIU11_09530 [Nakamurella sp.]